MTRPNSGAQHAILSAADDQATRLHLQHGPIDLIIKLSGDPRCVENARRDCIEAFDLVLPTLVQDLELLRRPLAASDVSLSCAGPIANTMLVTARQFMTVTDFITPMICVAGSVADAMLDVILRHPIQTALVNNGGDIALFAAPGESLTVGIVSRTDTATAAGSVRFGSHEAIRAGIATSGWRGRSFSLGIADAVTVIAASASKADAAATLIANAVSCDAPGISRASARSLQDDSDLGDLLVTTHCPELTQPQIDTAMANGVSVAQHFFDQKLIRASLIALQNSQLTIGDTASGRIAHGEIE